MSDVDDAIVSEFLLESRENLETIDHELLVLERHPDSGETLASVFRSIHTLKGTCGFLGFSRLETVAHAAEGLLGRLRAGEIAWGETIANLLGSMVEAVREMLGCIERTRADGETDYSALVAALRRASGAEAAPAEDAAPARASGAETGPPADAASTPASAPPAASSEPARPQRIFDTMIAEGRLDAEQVELALRQQMLGDPRRLGEILVDNGAIEPHEVLDALVTNGFTPQVTAPRSAIRVDVHLLERLMDQAGELVLARNQMNLLLAGRRLDALPAASQKVSAITTELQDAVLKTRMQPIQVVWAPLPRLARDTARACGKSVRFQLEGGATELDRTLLEAIKDPLIHAVRNAIDHGIELPEARRAAGKPAEGLVRLRASHQGGRVVIEISDDGAGIAVERVREKALRQRLVTPEAAARMTDAEWVEMVFTPGFSTAANVTRVSGRGVGMDVVKTNIERIGGTLEIRNRPGQGMHLEIRIPLTLAIVPALCVTAGGAEYALPQSTLLEILMLDPARGRAIERVAGVPVLRLRGTLLPLVFLAEMLGTGRADETAASRIVVLSGASRRFGLVVDGAQDFREIVVKPVSPRLVPPTVFWGATILGDGRVALILDPDRIAVRAGLVDGTPPAMDAGSGKAAEPPQARYLGFEVGDRRLALPLAEVARVETDTLKRSFAHADGRAVLHHDVVMPLVPVADELGLAPSSHPGHRRVVVVEPHGRPLGLVVDRILDLVEAGPALDTSCARRGIRGSVISGREVFEVLDPEALVASGAGGAAS